MKKTKWVYLIVLCLNFSYSYSYIEPKWIYYEGVIQLKNGDSLKGVVLLYSIVTAQGMIDENAGLCGFSKNYDFVSPNRFRTVTWIRFDEISKVNIIFQDKAGIKRFVNYINIGIGNRIWRVLKTNGSATLCDNVILPEYPIKYAAKKMILLSAKDTISLYSFSSWLFHDSNTKSLLKRFINKRYKKTFKKRDFKNEDEMMSYIVSNSL